MFQIKCTCYSRLSRGHVAQNDNFRWMEKQQFGFKLKKMQTKFIFNS